MADLIWDDQRISRLHILWGEGFSTAQIGIELGVSKNAVVGKAHRVGLSRPSPIKPPRDPAQPRRRNRIQRVGKTTLAPLPRTQAPVAPPPAPRPETHVGKVAPCCWPEGEPASRDFRFCEQPSRPGKPYCAAHCAKAYFTMPDRRSVSV